VVQADLFDKSPHKKAFADASMAGCITCHSNHRIIKPNDAFLGRGEGSVCVSCHVEGDDGFTVAVELRKRLAGLESAIATSDALLKTAELSGMEVSEARLEQDQARDALTKARVTLHSVKLDLVNQDLDAGLKFAAKAHAGSQAALKERDFRRYGLGISLIAILAVVIGLRLVILKIEKNA
jgi:predicted CXXCH cytochrome family protein